MAAFFVELLKKFSARIILDALAKRPLWEWLVTAASAGIAVGASYFEQTGLVGYVVAVNCALVGAFAISGLVDGHLSRKAQLANAPDRSRLDGLYSDVRRMRQEGVRLVAEAGLADNVPLAHQQCRQWERGTLEYLQANLGADFLKMIKDRDARIRPYLDKRRGQPLAVILASIDFYLVGLFELESELDRQRRSLGVGTASSQSMV